MQKIKYILGILSIFILWRCSETREINPEETGTTYFPLEVGNFSIYQVDGVEYINSADSNVFSYQLKETIVESFEDLEMGVSYKILRERRDDELKPWETDSIWTARKNEFRAIRTENNVPFVRLVFPLKENKTWDGNGFNNKETDEYAMINVGKPFDGEFSSFDNSTTVIQENIPDRIVNFISKKEIYSRDVGLIYKENIILKYKQGDFIGLEIVESGIRYFQSIITYGQE